MRQQEKICLMNARGNFIHARFSDEIERENGLIRSVVGW